MAVPSYTPPQFNLLARVWLSGRLPVNGDADRAAVPVQKYLLSRIGVVNYPTVAAPVHGPIVIVRSPRAQWPGPWPTWSASCWEIPMGSLQYYLTRWREVQHEGFVNQYAEFVCVQCTASGDPVEPWPPSPPPPISSSSSSASSGSGSSSSGAGGPGHDCGTATGLIPGEPFGVQFLPPLEEDWWRSTVTLGGPYHVHVTTDNPFLLVRIYTGSCASLTFKGSISWTGGPTYDGCLGLTLGVGDTVFVRLAAPSDSVYSGAIASGTC